MEVIKKFFVMLQFEEVMGYSVWDFSENAIIFGVLAISLFLLFWVFYKDKFQHRRIQPRRNPASLPVRKEIRNSIVSLLIFTTVDALVYLAMLKGHTRLYMDVSKYGWPYLLFSAGLIMVLHDAIYYFMHRAMHHPLLYDRVHKVHHQSTDPSPFATFSFHPIEAVMEAGVYVIFAFLLPLHVIALWIWQVLQISLSVVAHLGYEIYPADFNRHWLFKFKTPVTHHGMHHARFTGNYGLYFTWWDKIFRTEFNDYNSTFDGIHEKIKASKLEEPELSQPVVQTT